MTSCRSPWFQPAKTIFVLQSNKLVFSDYQYSLVARRMEMLPGNQSFSEEVRNFNLPRQFLFCSQINLSCLATNIALSPEGWRCCQAIRVFQRIPLKWLQITYAPLKLQFIKIGDITKLELSYIHHRLTSMLQAASFECSQLFNKLLQQMVNHMWIGYYKSNTIADNAWKKPDWELP